MTSGCAICSGGVKEGFHHNHASHTRLSKTQRIRSFVKQNMLSTLFSLTIFGLCVYLSWTCNTKQGIDVAMKVMYALCAGFFNILYLMYHFLIRSGSC